MSFLPEFPKKLAMSKKTLSQEEVIACLESIEDDDLDFDSGSDSEVGSDRVHNASEVEDVIDGGDFEDEEREDTIPMDTLQFRGKDGTEWSSQPPCTKRSRASNIIKSKLHKVMLPPGKVICDPADALSLFLNNDVLSEIATHTNNEARRVIKNDTWRPCDAIELLAFFGLLLTAGHLSANDMNFEVLWSFLYGPPIFRATMGLKRFKFLLRFLRFDNKETRPQRRENDKLAAIRDVWETVNKNFGKYYLPGENITVDEQLVPFRGRCPFKQYMPSKPDKYGMKIWWACDSKTFYPLNGIPYVGKVSKEITKGLGRMVVQQLVQPYFYSNRNITFDNYFTDMLLTENLLSHGLTCVGTVRKNKRFIPDKFLPNRNREETSSIFGFTNKATLVSYVPKKNRSVVVLSTMHHCNKVSDDQQRKPEVILYYNSTKGGVDSLDQMVHKYMCKRKTNRWPFAFFMNLLDVSSIASYVIWTNLHPEWNSNKHNKRHLFLISLSESLIVPHMRRRSARGLSTTTTTCISKFVEAEEDSGKKRKCESGPNVKRRCYMCAKTKDRKQKQCCEKCDKNICKEHSITQILCNNCHK